MTILVKPDTRLSKAFRLHPDILEYIIRLNPHDFERLRNPLMFKMMPPRITLARVAKMTNTPLLEILVQIHKIAKEPLSSTEVNELKVMCESETAVSTLPTNPASPPEWIEQEISSVVDLLEADERLDTDPMPPIFRALNPANVGDVILVKHKWEPQPLYDVWALRGIEHFAIQQSPDEWWIYLRKPENEQQPV